ncbi:hypothetical protein AVEN_79534-1 [Araneus ventricosus]|uniref:Reverse transcriptase domain-containing protein n=1 Tax=Araneus ventricosus TaxID=182803 RepID=A0A4Y2NA49_ARAVE|nr:hypothetical protein AVEN_79534-1 [Araneus ventricosus]
MSDLNQPACVALQETHLKPENSFRLHGYTVFRKDHPGNRVYGGVALLISNNIPSSLLTLNTPFQAIAAQIFTHKLITVCKDNGKYGGTLFAERHTQKPRKAWGRFRRYPTSANLILYKQVKAYSRRIRRRSQRESWERYISSLNSTISSKKLWEKVKKASGIFTDRNINILYQNGIPVTSLQDIANCIASTLSQTSNSNTYPSSFQNHKKLAEKQKLNFKSNSYAPYNRDFTFHELKVCLSEVKKTSPDPDNISYQMIKHLSSSSLQNLLHLYNRIWHEHCFPSSWQQAIIIPIPKPGKDPSNPLNYRPIALTNCLCKLMEKMVNRRLVYYLEHNKVLSPFQSGLRPGRCAIDNLLALETDIRTTFLKRQHLVAIFFDIEKAYDRTWKYGILQDLFKCNLRGNLPIFIQNFLRLRQFRVKVGYQLSDLFRCPTSVLQALSSLHRHSLPLAFSILDLHDHLVCKGFSILLCWVPSHVGISGNEIADAAAKNASAVLDNSTPLKDFKNYINLALQSRWENHCNSESMNKLRSIKPVVEPWPTLTNRKAYTIVTRLRVGHTRYTHRHLLMGDQAPMCTQCNCIMSVLHILSECPNFNSLRLRYFQSSSISLTDLLLPY